MQILKSCKTLIADGTFSVSPKLYTQVYIVHGLDKDGTALPLVYALLPNKQESSYLRFFSALARKMNDNGTGKNFKGH